MLHTSDGLEFAFLGESNGTKEMKLVSSDAKDMSQSQVEFSEDIVNLVVEDSEIDEDCSIWGKPKRKGSSIFRKPKRKEETTTIILQENLQFATPILVPKWLQTRLLRLLSDDIKPSLNNKVAKWSPISDELRTRSVSRKYATVL
ncbi:unnamed protein product [Arabidopsis thaliana]|uniref:Uncharacterized protein n=1 Tax=Arabidopsis thaliana TaxID=3702 RepID=Q9LJ53_ARATH|nr:uncharacterized protein AT3G29790 [Arabidopsis thaliana]AEE77611.1 hypothetical protein AT3G29790 [Arabidopsis thaliana]BAB02992.1 unnamed protein product [Arabidopsis thaliana]|eukprot:NP_189626.1 hypothetical protein AT3G29790 [Arabidopsis thaliana]